MTAIRHFAHRIVPLLIMAAALFAPAAAVDAQAQSQDYMLAPGQALPALAWDAPDSDGTNAPTSYIFETFRETDIGVVITTVDVPATSTTATLPASFVPTSGRFLVAVRAKGPAGVSNRSNALPFVIATVPGVPTNLRIVEP